MPSIFDGRLSVSYGQAFVQPAENTPALNLTDSFRGQTNGLCGAATTGSLVLVIGLHSGAVGFALDVLDAPPSTDNQWEEIVEVSFAAGSDPLALSTLDEDVCSVPLAPGSYRARYCARRMGLGQEEDDPEAEPKEFYSLSFWPAAPLPDVVVKQTSPHAAYWHERVQKLPR